MNKGKCIIFSAPSGSGKTTLVKHLLTKDELNLKFSVSVTTRQARESEKEGVGVPGGAEAEEGYER